MTGQEQSNSSTVSIGTQNLAGLLSSGAIETKPEWKELNSKKLLPTFGNEPLADSADKTNTSGYQSKLKTRPISRDEPELEAFIPLESWSGKIESIDLVSRTYSATVVSDQNSDVQETAQFSFDETSEDDLELIRTGAMFYWSVGYQIDKYRRRSTTSIIRFKRVRFWTRKELERATLSAQAELPWFLANKTQQDAAS